MAFNKRLLTVEDANSIIEHFGKAVYDYYTLDTRISDSQSWFAYDFIEIYCNTNNIQFKIQNSLWTGGYYIKECNIDDYYVEIYENYLNVYGDGLEYVVLVLELSTEFKYDNSSEIGFIPYYMPKIRPFYEDMLIDINFKDIFDSPVSDLEIIDKINDEVIYTDADGFVFIDCGSNIANSYNHILECEQPSGESVDYSFPYTRIKADLPVINLNNNLIMDKINLVSFKFLFDEKYNISEEMLFSDNNIQLLVNGKTYSINDYENDGSFDFLVDLRDYFADSVEMKLVIDGNDCLNRNTLTFIEDVNYFTTDNNSILKSEVESESGSDTIIFTGNVLNSPIEVNRDVTIEFTNPINNDGVSIIPFTVGNGSVLTLKGLDYTANNEYNVILVEFGDLICKKCTFQNCSNTVLISKKGDVTVENCVFNNNYSCINVNKYLSLYNTSFNLDDINYVDYGSVAFIKVLKDLTIDYCKFNIELTDLTSLGLSYLFFKIGKSCTVNGVKAGNLLVNQSFPVKYNTSNVYVESSRFIIHNSTNKCVIWTVEDTNTVYSNDMVVENVQ